MKKCPTCNRTYADNSLSFCLDDGTLLSAEYNSDETVAFSKEYPNPVQTDQNYTPDKSVATVVSSRANTSPPKGFHRGAEKKSIAPHVVYAATGLLVIVIIICGLYFLPRSSTSNNTSPQIVPSTTSPPSQESIVKVTATPKLMPSAEVPLRECTTPCSMNLGWEETIKTDGFPIRVKFNKKNEWFYLSGRASDNIPLAKFNPGGAQFASPDKTNPSIRVQIYATVR